MSHDTATLRQQLNTAFDDPELDAFCPDHFPTVYEKFSRGMRRDEKLTLLLNHCRRHPPEQQRLISLLSQRAEGLLPPAATLASKYHIDAQGVQIGIIGDDVKVEGGIHFGKSDHE